MVRKILAVVAILVGAMTFNAAAVVARMTPPLVTSASGAPAVAGVVAQGSHDPKNAGVSNDLFTPETANTTYELVPTKNAIQVTIDLRVENHEHSTTDYYDCIQYYWDPYYGLTPYDTTCTRTTNYYLSTTYAWTENNASGLKVSADHGTVTKSVSKRENGYILWKLTFSKIFDGQVRKIHLTYSIAGGQPRSTSPTRAGKAYAQFCATGNGPDGGTVNVVLPSSYLSSATSSAGNGAVASSTSGGKTVFRSGTVADPTEYYMCVEGTNEAAYRRATVLTPEGRQVTIESWPEDGPWLAEVQTEATEAAAALERLIGQDFPGTGALTIREVASGQLGDYSGTFDSGNLVADVSESLDVGTVAHELSHDWFNGTLFADRWLQEGSAGWAERGATSDEPACTAPDSYPGTGSPNLLSWQFLGPKSTATDEAVVGYQYDAACYIVSTAAQAMGANRMRDVLAYLIDRKVPYLPEAPAGSQTQQATWQTWLDIVDEVGMAPAGADLNEIQKLLATYGIATDAAQLGQRSQARQAYHDLEAAEPNWAVPAFVRRALSDWRFTDAIPELAAGSQLLTEAKATDAALPGADAVSGTGEVAFEKATSLADLTAAASSAQALEASAKAVATAVAASQKPVGILDGIGLIGVDLAALRTSAVGAVHAGNASSAQSQAAQLTNDVQQASSNGALRLGAIVATLLACSGAYLLIRRRRRAALALSTNSVATAKVDPADQASEGPVPETGIIDDAPGVGVVFGTPEGTVANSILYMPPDNL